LSITTTGTCGNWPAARTVALRSASVFSTACLTSIQYDARMNPSRRHPVAFAVVGVVVVVVATALAGCTVSLKPRSAECVIGTLLGAGCAPLQRASDDLDNEAKQFLPAQGKANLYVVRPSIFGGRYLWAIEIDGKPVGAIAEHTYILLELAPGQYAVTAVTGETRHTLAVDVKTGGIVIVEVVSRMGMTQSRAELRELPSEQGRVAVTNARRAAMPPATNECRCSKGSRDPPAAGGRALALVAITGWGNFEAHERAVEAAFDAHFTKPPDPERLAALIAHLANTSVCATHRSQP